MRKCALVDGNSCRNVDLIRDEPGAFLSALDEAAAIWALACSPSLVGFFTFVDSDKDCFQNRDHPRMIESFQNVSHRYAPQRRTLDRPTAAMRVSSLPPAA